MALNLNNQGGSPHTLGVKAQWVVAIQRAKAPKGSWGRAAQLELLLVAGLLLAPSSMMELS